MLNRGTKQTIRAGIAGTGFIADFHAEGIAGADGVDLTAVCDTSLASAQGFANKWGVSKVFGSLEAMLRDGQLDCVHILAPPDRHHSLAKLALQAGVSVLIEKPMCTSVEEAQELVALAREKGLYAGVGHNMQFAGAYERLRDAVRSGRLGPLDHVTFTHFAELGQIRIGPFDNWMLRQPQNVMLEIGPHLVSGVYDLVGAPGEISVVADRVADLPGGGSVARRWRIQTSVGTTAVDININLGPGFGQRTISAHGLAGSAIADLDANTCMIDCGGPLSVDFDRYQRSGRLASQLRSQARLTLAGYALAKLNLSRRGSPYQATIVNCVASFYASMRAGAALDSRIEATRGRDVVDSCLKIAQSAGQVRTTQSAPRPQKTLAAQPTVLVFGGTGFIGRELIRQLLAAGHCVRAAVRGSGAVLTMLESDRLELVRTDIGSEADLATAMKGIEYVYHLARVDAKSWADNLRRDVEPTRLIAKACLAAGVKRLIYTGTIDSFYAGRKAGTITHETPLDQEIERRNYYARAKAAAEDVLIGMHRSEKLPVVIFRPGIVIGQGGNPFHWGVGLWTPPSLCQVWGEGNNKLPFVLVADVAAALVRGMDVGGLDGKAYNLVDVPLLSANDYVSELQQKSGLHIEVRNTPIWRFYLEDLAKWAVKVGVRHPDRMRVPSYSDWESRTQQAVFDCSASRSDLNWQPASDRRRMIDDGIGGSLRSWLAASQ